jgi:mycothiol synthase
MEDPRQARRDDATAIANLLARCQAADDFPALSEFKALRVPRAAGVKTVVVDDGEALRAVGVAAWHAAKAGDDAGYWAAEIALDPHQRTTEAYLEVLEALTTETGDAVSLWTFSQQQRVAALAGGMTEVRALVLMERPLPAETAEFPPGVTVRSFVPGSDEAEWLVLNRRVFGDHPEAAAIDAADLDLRMAQPWFDPAGFLILIEDGAPIGYCWTKRHSPDLGEIYMIGLVPEARGRGLARPLTRAGLDYLSRTGSGAVILYAEATNEPAIGLYGSMGFATIRRIALFEVPADG